MGAGMIASECKQRFVRAKSRRKRAHTARTDVHGERGPSVTKTFPSTRTPSLDTNSTAAGVRPTCREVTELESSILSHTYHVALLVRVVGEKEVHIEVAGQGSGALRRRLTVGEHLGDEMGRRVI